ncbi:peptidase MA family metallohydrolase [Candidatus Amarobacter glycogenicus]|uniref:peptidase MA family metallohydrolase n=1 Tax=Candidatus Amarobacter glycogenicus TaxID=3140699 RepID=UPI00313612A8|nr:hypothetical protein [Dehalococcoidia bacterium]
MPRVALTFFAALVASLSLMAAPSTASAETVIESSALVNGYPATLTFKVTARADSDITDVTLNYAIKGRGTSALDKPKNLTPARNLSTEVVIQVNSSSNYIPVGSDFTYHWEITTADGGTYRGPDLEFFFLPPGKDWKNVSNEFMTVYYHGDRENIASAYLKAGVETYERIGKQLYNITLKQIPVKVIMFADESESDLARPGSGSTYDSAVTTCGTKVEIDIILLIPVTCGTPDRTDTLRHEFAHTLNETAGEGVPGERGLGKLPSWMDEGAAVYAQSVPGEFESDFASAVRSGRLIPFSQMAVPTSNPNQVGVFYGQSWAMVSYLINKGGPEAYSRLMATIKAGKRYDQAISEVYGFADLNAFESAFKSAVGAPQQTSPTVRPTTAATPTPRAQASATATRTSAAAASPGAGDDDSVGRGTIVIGGIAVLFLLAAVFALLISLMMANNRKSSAGNSRGSPPPESR